MILKLQHLKRLIVSIKHGTNIYNSFKKLEIVDDKGHKVKFVRLIVEVVKPGEKREA
ncbi:hypothetical protein OCF62_17895 [Bacillus wiedmannii]|uniref:hypothetical protein n=1 Tax=Bacillus wiedmannii TaxID=1890302 RepID=UPI0021CF8B92|nr:hypothetical protein [Bacillus wiedmannii]MCU5516444.1 hypothetical protein [Bacillus wiedmannii]